MPATERGEVWLADLGMVAKVRPVLVISIEPADVDRALIGIVPHTTSVRGSRFEVASSAPFLRAGAFDAQNIVSVPTTKMIKRLGRLSEKEFGDVMFAVRQWLGIA